MTERSLARLTGISQPHMHNVLKGARLLSPELADHILISLHLSVLDLIDRSELSARLSPSPQPCQRFVWLPVLQGPIGPGQPPPKEIARDQRYPIATHVAERLQNPVVAFVTLDEEMDELRDNQAILLDRSERSRALLAPEGLYLVCWQRQGLIRRVRTAADRILLLSSRSSIEVPLKAYELFNIILARAHLLGPDPGRPAAS